MAKVVFKPTVQHNVIFTFDDKDQEILDFSFANIPVYEEYESEYIRQIILKVIGEENAKALSKISMCVACDEKDFFKLPLIKSVFERDGKYYFQPNQRDDIENEIIQGTKIASLTKDF